MSNVQPYKSFSTFIARRRDTENYLQVVDAGIVVMLKYLEVASNPEDTVNEILNLPKNQYPALNRKAKDKRLSLIEFEKTVTNSNFVVSTLILVSIVKIFCVNCMIAIHY